MRENLAARKYLRLQYIQLTTLGKDKHLDIRPHLLKLSDGVACGIKNARKNARKTREKNPQ